jgi:ATP synthase subunit 6
MRFTVFKNLNKILVRYNIFQNVLEQFEIVPFLSIDFMDIVFFTNEIVTLLLIFFFFSVFFLSNNTHSSEMLIIPNRYQAAFIKLENLILGLINDNIKGVGASKFFPFVFTNFLFILVINLIGLIPYSFTLTSHIIITALISVSSFIGINILSIKKNKIKFFAIFMPAGTSLVLSFLLIPIEIISYFFKPISLAIRLFANMMAGHTLLKVIAGFAHSLSSAGGFLIILSFFPLGILLPLFFLEFAVALIQTFVFTVLLCIYINDSLNISH